MIEGIVPSSFRDPSGFLFVERGVLYRQINRIEKGNYDHLMNSGLYKALVDADLLIPHIETSNEHARSDSAYRIIQPELIPFISYPYEWSFSQLKHAALQTLKIQSLALRFGMSLKDCSAYNIQFRKGKPIFIDTLSFEKYLESEPWVAYGQFCRHFLAPLALMSYRDIRLNQLLRLYIDGLPLDLVSTLLPLKTCFWPSLCSHLHLHAKMDKRFGGKPVDTKRRKISRMGLRGLVENLRSTVRKLDWQPQGTEWAQYYQDTNYSADGFQHKRQLIAEFLEKTEPRHVWDLGANVGLFSRISSDRTILTVAFDVDAAAVEKNYLESFKNGETHILPLVMDLTNPSSALGWAHQERMSLLERGPADTVLALALVHHLAIGNNLPLSQVADFLHRACRFLIIEFVPKTDSQVQRLLVTRQDIFPNYTREAFEKTLSEYFDIQASIPIRDSQRTLYLMQNRKGK